MGAHPDKSDCYTCSTYDAVLEFARARYAELARKVIARLQKVKATGIYGDDLSHRTLWDEFCYEQHEGPTEHLVEAWRLTTLPFFDDVLRKIPGHEEMLLTIGAAWDSEADDAPVGIRMDLIRAGLEDAVVRAALDRNIDRLR